MDSRTVFEDSYFTVAAASPPLNSRQDGGHLVLRKREPVRDRSDLTGKKPSTSCASAWQ